MTQLNSSPLLFYLCVCNLKLNLCTVIVVDMHCKNYSNLALAVHVLLTVVGASVSELLPSDPNVNSVCVYIWYIILCLSI